MAAGQGFKTFATGDILTASDVNGYLMQGVLVFASTAARDAAITSPQQGQVALTKDTNTIWKYTGATWTNIDTGAVDPLTTKGDLWGYSTTDARVPVGTNGQVLTADSTQALGLKWATPASVPTAFTLLNAGGTALTGATSITISGISAKEIVVLVNDASSVNAGAEIRVRPNNSTSAIYDMFGVYNVIPATWNAGYFDAYGLYQSTNGIQLAAMPSNAAGTVRGSVYIDKTDQTGFKRFQSVGSGRPSGTSYDFHQYTLQGILEFSTAITSITIFSNSGNFDGGTVYVYGS